MKNVRIVLVGFAVVALAAACSKKDESATEETEEGAEATKPAEDEAAEAEAAADTEEAAAEDEEAAAATEDADEVEKQAVAFLGEVATAGTENIDDCDAIASQWRTLIDENQDLLGQMRERAATQTEEEQAAFEARNQEFLGQFMQDMGKVMQSCQDNEKIANLAKELSTQ